jgi:hypothetical protein
LAADLMNLLSVVPSHVGCMLYKMNRSCPEDEVSGAREAWGPPSVPPVRWPQARHVSLSVPHVLTQQRLSEEFRLLKTDARWFMSSMHFCKWVHLVVYFLRQASVDNVAVCFPSSRGQLAQWRCVPLPSAQNSHATGECCPADWS